MRCHSIANFGHRSGKGHNRRIHTKWPGQGWNVIGLHWTTLTTRIIVLMCWSSKPARPPRSARRWRKDGLELYVRLWIGVMYHTWMNVGWLSTWEILSSLSQDPVRDVAIISTSNCFARANDIMLRNINHVATNQPIRRRGAVRFTLARGHHKATATS